MAGGIPGERSHGGPLRDHVSFVDHLRARGLMVDPVGSVRQPFLRGKGTRLRLSGGGLTEPVELQSFFYHQDDLGVEATRAAEEDADGIGPDGHPENAVVEWTGTHLLMTSCTPIARDPGRPV